MCHAVLITKHERIYTPPCIILLLAPRQPHMRRSREEGNSLLAVKVALDSLDNQRSVGERKGLEGLGVLMSAEYGFASSQEWGHRHR